MRDIRVLVVVLLFGCAGDRFKQAPLFTNITGESGIVFSNDLSFTERLNPYTYRNFYNGAGVAIGDVNNDGLLDVFFAGNQVDNRLYLNQGNLVFKDITETAGVASPGAWSTGVTFVDINGDSFLDIYVCKSGDPDSPRRNNELFVNNGDLTFTESSAEYGVDVKGLSVQAAFFDVDKDDDLDCYLLTNSIKSVGNYDLVANQRNTPDPLGGGNKLFINDNGTFRDHSAAAGIYHSDIGFGLGVTLGDFNNDSWTDIFVSNDFFERDYLYINNQDGTFTESLTSYFASISMGSMGADFADLDNDGIPELFVTEMLPDSLNRRKTKTLYESWDKYQLSVGRGYHHQFPRNVLQKKVGPNQFIEIGRFAGVAASEWSWGALLFDMDSDGWKDIFIANGIYKDLLDRDYLAYTREEQNVRELIRTEKNAILKLIDLMPSSQFSNYAFKNNGNLTFTNIAREWGLADHMYSTGSAYGDLDNDGDLDLVVNNIDGPAVLYRNNTDTSEYKSVSISLYSRGKNTMCLGAQVAVFCSGQTLVADNFTARGFQSAVPSRITIGIGKGVSRVDSLLVRWPDGGISVLYNIPANGQIDIRQEESRKISAHPYFNHANTEVIPMQMVSSGPFRHQDAGLIDFNRDRLLPMMYGNETPSLLQGDIDGDGKEEIYVGGGKDQRSAIIHFDNGRLESVSPDAFATFQLSEETSGALIDVDNDNDLDLYVASGGRFFPKTSSALADRLFLNKGDGTFHESPDALPFTRFFSTSTVEPIDFDNDGDIDLLVGERFDPFVYGQGGGGYLLQNDGRGTFSDVTEKYAPALAGMGMITDMEVCDFNADGWRDVMIVGDWMPIIMLQNDKGRVLKDVSPSLGLVHTRGWWHVIESDDLNEDGRTDFVIGNHGLNTFFREGDRMYLNDFDRNGSIEQLFCTVIDDKYYPIVDKDEFVSQLPSFRKEVLYYSDYGRKSINELVPADILNTSTIFEANVLSSILLLSSQDGYERVNLPTQAQFAPIYSLLICDINKDGVKDIVAGGNQYGVKPQFGRHDASTGWLFRGSVNDSRYSLQPGLSLGVEGEIRDIKMLKVDGVTYLIFAKHDDNLEIYKLLD